MTSVRSGRARMWGATASGAILVSAVAVSLFLAEVTVRVLHPQQLIVKRPDLWAPDSQLGWVRRPHVRTTINTGEGTVHVYTDGYGYRVAARGQVSGGRPILLLGDSFMEALQVEYEQSLAGLLELRLAELLGQPVAVRNAAVSGWDPDQYLLQARRSLSQEQYALIVVALYLGNDIVDRERVAVPARVPAQVHRLRLPGSLRRDELTDALLYPLNDWLEVRSHLFILAKRSFDGLLTKLGLSAKYTFYLPYIRAYHTGSEANSPRWKLTADLCRRIAEAGRDHGAGTVVLIIPASYAADPETFMEYVTSFGIDSTQIDADQPRRLMLEALAAAGVPTVDATPALQQARSSEPQPYGSVDPHLTARGHEVLARTVLPYVLQVLTAAQ